MAFNPTNPVTVGAATKKDHYDRVFNNTTALYGGEMALPNQGPGHFVIATSSTQVASKRSYVKVFLEVFGG